MVGHMVTVAVIATLVKQLMQLKFNLHDLKVELCDQQTDTVEFRNTFCEKNSKHASDQATSKTSETETETKTKRRTETKTETKPGLKTKTEIGITTELETKTEKKTNLETEIQTEVETKTDAGTHFDIERERKLERWTETETYTKTKLGQQAFLDSSVWCHDKEGGICHFHNLCYNSEEDDLFIMVGNESQFENVDLIDGSILLDLSSVKDHNVHQKYVGSIAVDNSGKLDISWIEQTALLFNRFKPDNLMHVLHDDILPMYNTLKLILMAARTSTGNRSIFDRFEIQLVFFEGWDLGEFSELYQLFSVYPVVAKDILKSKGKIACLRNAYTGISKSTTWYDYGFSKPQGPIDNYKVTGSVIHGLAKYVLKQFHSSDEIEPSSAEYLVLLTRQQNRKILNEVDLTLEIVQKLGIKVLNLNFEMFEFSKIVSLVHHSKGIIGMHGSLLSLAIFLKPGSVLVELFPYAVNPSQYTPFKTLAAIDGMGLMYKAWSNTKLENTVGHPGNPADEGGLGHLSDEDRVKVMEQTEVPPHLCCSDPSWLYHIYQDTVVDIKEVLSLVESSLEESENYFHQSEFSFHPTQVKNVSCVVSKTKSSGNLGRSTRTTLLVNWSLPWTVEYIERSENIYEILLQDMNNKTKVKSYKADKPPFVVDLDKESIYFVWIKCVLNQTLSGPYSDACQCIEVI